jgi:hypothetical protein
MALFSRGLVRDLEGIPGIYVIAPLDNPKKIYKIGMANHNLASRIGNYVTCFVKFRVHHIIALEDNGYSASGLESLLKKELKDYRLLTQDKRMSEWSSLIDVDGLKTIDKIINKVLKDLNTSSRLNPIFTRKYRDTSNMRQTRSGPKEPYIVIQSQDKLPTSKFGRPLKTTNKEYHPKYTKPNRIPRFTGKSFTIKLLLK